MLLSVTLTLFTGFIETFKLFALTALFAIPLGLCMSFCSMNTWKPFAPFRKKLKKTKLGRFIMNFRPVSAVMGTIIWIIRGTPLMIQILVIFYGPGLMFGWSLLDRFVAALIAFVINYSCYFSEIFRGGIQSIPVGQNEAGQVLGMTKSQIFFKVTLLQVVKRIVPPMSNELITLVKDTALVRVISVYEVLWMGESYIKKGMIWPLFYTAVFYLAFNGILTIVFAQVEKKLEYFR